MDLIQPGIMSKIVDEGILGLNNGGVGNLHLIWTLGLKMAGLVLFGGICGSLNNAFVHLSGQNIGNKIRKDCFRKIMTFSYSQIDRFGTGSLVTRVTNDITQVQNFVSQFVRGMYEKIRFGKANDELVGTQLQVLVIFAFMNPVINALMYIVVAVILLAGSYEVRKGIATPGTIMAAITYTTQLLNGILMLVMLFQNISRGLVSWKRIKEILSNEPDLKDGGFDGKTKPHGEIEFRNVSFAYPGSSQLVLRHINLTIHKGETIAVMGATGCGKTSLIGLIPPLL